MLISGVKICWEVRWHVVSWLDFYWTGGQRNAEQKGTFHYNKSYRRKREKKICADIENRWKSSFFLFPLSCDVDTVTWSLKDIDAAAACPHWYANKHLKLAAFYFLSPLYRFPFWPSTVWPVVITFTSIHTNTGHLLVSSSINLKRIKLWTTARLSHGACHVFVQHDGRWSLADI